MNAIILWLTVITVSQHVHGTEITVNNDVNGDNSAFCCVYGFCQCSSFSYALSSTRSNSVIKITSPIVSLDVYVYLRNLRNITISSNDSSTVMCSNVGNVLFDACSDVTIEGITWDQCGDINDPEVPGITIDVVSNISIKDCTFQHFKACVAVSISSSGYVHVTNSKFMYNTISNASMCSSFYSSLLLLLSGNPNVAINSSLFLHNGHSLHGNGSINGTLYIFLDQQTLSAQSILVRNTSFISNGIGSIYVGKGTQVTFDKLNVSGNRFGINVLVTGKLQVTSSQFMYNNNGALDVQLGDNSNVELSNTTFANNNATTANTVGTALYVSTGNNSTVSLSLCNFYDNIGGNSIVDISTYIPINHPFAYSNVLINSTNFLNNKIGSALRALQCIINFHSTTVF